MAALLLLHRGFFGKALETEDVAKSQFSPSVLATFNCAWRIVDALKILYSQHPELAKRFGLFWSNAFSAYVRDNSLNISHTNYVSDIFLFICYEGILFTVC